MTFLLAREPDWRIALTVALGSIALLLTLSDGGLLTWLIVLILYRLYPQGSRNRHLRSWLAPVLFLAIIGTALWRLSSIRLLDSYVETLSSIGKVSLNVLSARRLDLYQYSLADSIRHPFFGQGLGFPTSGESIWDLARPHNLVLEALRQGGLVNVFVFSGALVSAGARLWRQVRHNQQVAGEFFAPLAILIMVWWNPTCFRTR